MESPAEWRVRGGPAGGGGADRLVLPRRAPPASPTRHVGPPPPGPRWSNKRVRRPPAGSASEGSPGSIRSAVKRFVIVHECRYPLPAAQHVVLGLHVGLEASGADREEREDHDVERLLAVPQPCVV